MKTNPDDIAADLDDLGGRIVAARERLVSAENELATAREVLDRLVMWSAKLGILAQMLADLDTIEDRARDHVRRAADMPF